MRMPLVCSSAVGVCGVFTLFWLPARLAAAEPDPDEALLRRAGVSLDDKALLAFFRDRAGTDADLTRGDSLGRQLGSPTFKVREEAAERLVRLGWAADEALSAALLSKDSEVVARAKTILRQIREGHDPAVVSAALRLLTRKRPEGAAGALLRYLPYAAHGPLADDLWWSLDALAAARPKADPAVGKALDDPVAIRRAAAAYLAARRGEPGQQESARKLLADAEPLVRLRAAQGLLGRGRKEAIPVLVDLLRGTPLELAWQAEELLHWAAGDQAPEAVVGAGGEAARRRCGDAWRAWWKARGDALDLSRVARSGRRPGLVLVSWGDVRRGQVTLSGVWLLGCSGKPRLEIKMRTIVQDLHLLPGGRLLLAEDAYGDPRKPRQKTPKSGVTIRDAEGEVLWKWEKATGTCYPLAGGNLLIVSGRAVTEVTPVGETVWSHDFGLGRREVPPLDCPQRLPNGNFVGILEPGRGRVDLVETDPEGARVVRQVTVKEDIRPFPRGRIETTPGGNYLLVRTADFMMREIDGSGKTVWKSRPLGARDVALLKDGTLVVAAGNRVVELTRAGGVAWEALVPAETGAWAARPCLRLIRLGFDTPRPADLDLDASVEYRLAGLGKRESHVRQWSAKLLGDMGRKAEEAVPALISILRDPDEEMRLSAESALTQVVGLKMLPRLLAVAQDKDPRVRVAVVSICGQLPDQSQAVVPTLIRALQDHADAIGGPRRREIRVSQAAASSLGNLGPRAKDAVPALVATLKTKDITLRWLAAAALGRIGPAAKPAIPALKELLNDPDNVVRINATESLKRIQR